MLQTGFVSVFPLAGVTFSKLLLFSGKVLTGKFLHSPDFDSTERSCVLTNHLFRMYFCLSSMPSVQ